MSIYERLHEDHELVAGLTRQIADAEAVPARRRLFGELKQALDLHSLFEEEVFYPAVAVAAAEAKPTVEIALDEHDDVAAMLEDLNELEPDAPEWADEFAELAAAIGQHVAREEEEIFALARRHLPAAQAEELAEQFDIAKAELPRRKSA